MNDTDGLLAEASVESDDNQQQAEETTISHQLPDNEPSLDDVTVAKEDEEIDLARPESYREKLKPLKIMTRAFLRRPGLVTMTLFIMFIETGQKKMVSASQRLSNWLGRSLKWLKAKVSKLRSHIRKNMKSLATTLIKLLSR